MATHSCEANTVVVYGSRAVTTISVAMARGSTTIGSKRETIAMSAAVTCGTDVP